MSFFSKISHALGFGSSEDPEYDSIYDDTASDIDGESPQEIDSAEKPEQHTIAPVVFDAGMQQQIFNKVVEVFDAALPEFIGKACNQDVQKKMLYDSLDQGIKEYLASIGKMAEDYCDAQWKAKQTMMASEMEAMRVRAGEIEKQSSDIKQKQLSADRQKRALTERVHDLESQIAKLESEREQYELENRSLVNRIKVANVQQEDLDKTQAELQSLRLELNTIRQNPDAAFAKIEEELRGQIAEMSDGIDSLKEQLRVSEEMREDQRKRSSESDKKLQEQAHESDSLKLQLENLKKDLAKKTIEVNELNDLLKEYDEITKRMGEFDRAMTKLEEKIKSQNKIIEQRDSEIENLKATMAENMRMADERELHLKKQLDNLRPESIVAEMQVDFGVETEPDEAPRISEDELSAMEEAFESGDWFTKTPPADTPSMRPADSEMDFGYKAPRRKTPTVSNPDQLSLF